MERTWRREYGPELKKLRERKGLSPQMVADELAKWSEVAKPEGRRLPGGDVRKLPRSDDAILSYEAVRKNARNPSEAVLEGLAAVYGFASADDMLDSFERGVSETPPDLDDFESAAGEPLKFEEWIARLEEAVTGAERAPQGPRVLFIALERGNETLMALRRFYQSERRPRVEQVRVLRLAAELVAQLEGKRELDARFGEALDANLDALHRLLQDHGAELETTATPKVPPFHGYLYGDDLFRGTWRKNQYGEFDGRTALEHWTLQGAEEKHLEFHFCMQPDLALPEKLGLQRGEYAIFGSGPLAVRGLRPARDVDVIVTPAAWSRLAELYPPEPHDHGLRKIQVGKVEVLDGWHPHVAPIEELIGEAEFVLGVPFVKLERVREWKTLYGRDKDKSDVEMIKKYLERRERPPRVSAPRIRKGVVWGAEQGGGLRMLLENRGVDTRELARETEIELRQLDGYVAGTKMPRRETLETIALKLGFENIAEFLAAVAQCAPAPGGSGTAEKTDQILRAVVLPAHKGETLQVHAGTADVTLTILERAYEGGDAARRRPLLSRVVLHRLSDQAATTMERNGELEPGFAEELKRNAAAIRGLLQRHGAGFEERMLDGRPETHGYEIGRYKFLGRWQRDARGFWHARTPFEARFQ